MTTRLEQLIFAQIQESAHEHLQMFQEEIIKIERLKQPFMGMTEDAILETFEKQIQNDPYAFFLYLSEGILNKQKNPPSLPQTVDQTPIQR